MSSDRLREIEGHLKLLREQKVALEQEALLEGAYRKTQNEQRLRVQIKPKIQEYEQEYWQLLTERSQAVEIQEPDPEVVVAEIVEQAGQLQSNPQYSDEVMAWLQKIHAEVSKPGAPAAAKLKGALSLMPPFINITYEGEIDTEHFLRTNFPTFMKWSQALAKKR
jgi:hypothetical protein